MLLATAKTKDNRPLLILGLEEGNLTKLREGKPIFHDLAEFGLGHLGQFVIFWGETAGDLRDTFSRAGAVIDEHTKVIDQSDGSNCGSRH